MTGRDWSPLRFDCSLPARCAWRRDARGPDLSRSARICWRSLADRVWPNPAGVM
jgi:hypothetical protein